MPAAPTFSTQDQQYRQAADAHARDIARFVAGYERDPARRPELLQEVHLALWRSMAAFNRQCSLRTWVYRVAHNVGVSHVQRSVSAREYASVSLDEAAAQADDQADIVLIDRRLDLDKVLLISATKLSDGSYVAGGERGTVWHADSFDGPWQPAALPYAGQSTAWLGEADGKLFAIGMDNGKARLYQRSADWTWAPVGEYGTKVREGTRELAYDYDLVPRVVTRGRELLVYDDHSRYRFDAGTAKLSKIDDQGSFLVQQQPNGIVVSNADSFWFGGVGAPQISRDGGMTWEPYHRLGKWGGALYVFADGTPMAIDSDIGFSWKGWEKEAHPSVLISSDKGKTQRAIGQVAFGCNRIEGQISTDELLYLYCFDGSLLKSTDRGRSWVPEYSRAVRADRLPAEFFGPKAKK